MQIFDCTTYFEEDLMMDVRFNILNQYVDKFIVCEAQFTHSGNKKKINFDINKFSKFKDKIDHIVIENEPDDIIKVTNGNAKLMRSNSIKRINYQRNYILNSLKNANSNDIIMYSDNDEIPNLENINLRSFKEKIIVFKQKIFYYKFNLLYKRLDWYGTKCCRYKNLKTIDTLREIKPKKFNFFRIDTLFSDLKHINIKIIDDGGWHFTNLKSPEDLMRKYLNDELHSEFITRKIDVDEIKRLIKEKKINYDHFADSKSNNKQFNEFQLVKAKENILPRFILENKNNFKEWLI
tara:strand:+ start:54 stop:932 length:879 start_codon:yes stop_codon:yes gene_type:complete